MTGLEIAAIVVACVIVYAFAAGVAYYAVGCDDDGSDAAACISAVFWPAALLIVTLRFPFIAGRLVVAHVRRVNLPRAEVRK